MMDGAKQVLCLCANQNCRVLAELLTFTVVGKDNIIAKRRLDAFPGGFMVTHSMRIAYLLLLLSPLILIFGCRAQRGKAPILSFNQLRTNVIVILTDDQGYGDMSCHGNPFLKTPNLDALHGESVRLTDFHVDPTCSPTRAALMTGRYSSRVGVWLTYGGRNHLRRDEVTMADAFKNTGYKTVMFGKWHLGDNYPFRPQDRGFDESLIHGGGVVGETPDYWGNNYYDDTYFRNGKPEKVEGYCTDVWFDEAADWIEENKKEPFFLYLATNAPHGPLHAPIETIQPYLDAGIPERRARFYGMIQVIDENVGKLRDRLEALEMVEDTIVVFLTDNGTASGAEFADNNGFVKTGFNAGMRGKKGTAYEGGHRAAGFIHWPKGNLVHGTDISQITSQIDLFPTLAELCNLKLPKKVKFDGTDLTPLLRGKSNSWPERTLFVHHQGRFGEFVGDGPLIKYKDFSVMTEEWRLVGKELYAIQSDPEQRQDVAAENPKVATSLSKAYETWWEEISEKSEQYAPFVMDSSQQDTITLSSQNWHGDTVPYNQHHVRTAMEGNGFWVVEIIESGSYEITVRRWPKGVSAPLGGLAELGPFSPAKHNMNNRMIAQPTTAIPVKSVRLKVGDYDQTVAVRTSDEQVAFSAYLSVGEHKVQTWLNTDAGDNHGAYYVYLRKI